MSPERETKPKKTQESLSCPKCRKKMPPSVFCPNCGTRLIEAPTVGFRPPSGADLNMLFHDGAQMWNQLREGKGSVGEFGEFCIRYGELLLRSGKAQELLDRLAATGDLKRSIEEVFGKGEA